MVSWRVVVVLFVVVVVVVVVTGLLLLLLSLSTIGPVALPFSFARVTFIILLSAWVLVGAHGGLLCAVGAMFGVAVTLSKPRENGQAEVAQLTR